MADDGDSKLVSEVKDAYFVLVRPIAEKYSLLLERKVVPDAPFIGNITIDWNSAHEPSPISPFNLESEAWLVFSRAVQATFGPDVITTPSAMTGNTGMSGSSGQAVSLNTVRESDTRFYVSVFLICHVPKGN